MNPYLTWSVYLSLPRDKSFKIHLEFLTVHVEQLRAVDTSGSKLWRVLVHVHGD